MPSKVIVPADEAPSPQLIVAEYWLRASGPPGSLNLATTVEAGRGLPSVPLMLIGVPGTTAGSLTLAVLVVMALGAVLWRTVTVMVNVPDELYLCDPLTL